MSHSSYKILKTNKSLPNLSFIFTSLNENTIKKNLESIINLKLQNIEIILIDKSNDDHLIKEFSCTVNPHKRIKTKIIKQISPSGLGAARNIGIKNSLAKFITFVDADDFILGGYYEKALEIINNEGSDFIIGKALTNNILKKTTYPLSDSSVIKKICNNKEFITTNIQNDLDLLNMEHNACKQIIRRSFLIREEIKFESLKYAEDFYFHFIKLLKSSRITIYNEFIYEYTIQDNLTSSPSSWINDILDSHFKTLVYLKTIDSKKIQQLMIISSLSIVYEYTVRLQKNNKEFINRYMFLLNQILTYTGVTKKEILKTLENNLYKYLTTKSILKKKYRFINVMRNNENQFSKRIILTNPYLLIKILIFFCIKITKKTLQIWKK